VICPGFVADCLETLEEIALEGKTDFLKAGGGEYHYIAALNDRPVWINALADLALAQMGGWIQPTYDADMEKMGLELQRQRAQTMGAKNLFK
jgi:ferrochelatase